MLQTQTRKDSVLRTMQEKEQALVEFAEVFCLLPESSRREVLGYAKCLYASEKSSSAQSQVTN